MSNAFRMTPDKSLDRTYLRVCAVYRFFIRGCIDKARAIELLDQRHVRPSQALVELWMNTRAYKELVKA